MLRGILDARWNKQLAPQSVDRHSIRSAPEMKIGTVIGLFTDWL
jgi:hypothetical protein